MVFFSLREGQAVLDGRSSGMAVRRLVAAAMRGQSFRLRWTEAWCRLAAWHSLSCLLSGSDRERESGSQHVLALLTFPDKAERQKKAVLHEQLCLCAACFLTGQNFGEHEARSSCCWRGRWHRTATTVVSTIKISLRLLATYSNTYKS